MGREVCRAVLARPGLELAAAVDPGFAGVELSELIGAGAGKTAVTGELDAMTAAGVEVAVDFTRIEAARVNLPFCAESGIHAVVGTTGLTASDLEDLGHRFTGVGRAPNCIVAPNFAIGAVLMMRFAELAAPWFSGAEIIELHREGKLDAPSGTAMRTAEMIAGLFRRRHRPGPPATSPPATATPPIGPSTVSSTGPVAVPVRVVCACTRCGFPASWLIKKWSSVVTVRH